MIRILAIAAPLALGVGIQAASAGNTYTPAVNALTAINCDLEVLTFNLDGAKAGTQVTGTVKFDNRTPVAYSGTAIGNGGYGGAATFSKEISYPRASTKKFTITANYTDPFNQAQSATYTFNRGIECPGLPVTGGNAAPVGKIALGVTLGGALMAAVAIRRRPRKSTTAA